MSKSANKKEMEWHPHKGRPLMIAGFVLFLVGILRFYNVDWPIVLMVVGAVLFLKGLMVKLSKK